MNIIKERLEITQNNTFSVEIDRWIELKSNDGAYLDKEFLDAFPSQRKIDRILGRMIKQYKTEI